MRWLRPSPTKLALASGAISDSTPTTTPTLKTPGKEEDTPQKWESKVC